MSCVIKLNTSRLIVFVVVAFASWRAFGLIWALLSLIVIYLAFYYTDKFPLSKKQKEIKQNHIMNYTYSYFGGIFAAIAIAFVLGQNPLKLLWSAILGFLLITYGAGLVCCTLIKFAFYKK